MEIERQFLIEDLPEPLGKGEALCQGYLSLEPEIRIRSIDEKQFFLTVKRGSGLVRQEWETEITAHEFQNLCKRLEPGMKIIEKERYHFPLDGGLQIELHVHKGHLAGFNYAEVEFPSEEAARAFIPPAWFGREVTEEPLFSYQRLGKADGLKWVQDFLTREGD